MDKICRIGRGVSDFGLFGVIIGNAGEIKRWRRGK
jgi:hypothetical protein